MSKIARLLCVTPLNLVDKIKYQCFEGWYAPAKLPILDNSNLRIHVKSNIFIPYFRCLFTYQFQYGLPREDYV